MRSYPYILPPQGTAAFCLLWVWGRYLVHGTCVHGGTWRGHGVPCTTTLPYCLETGSLSRSRARLAVRRPRDAPLIALLHSTSSRCTGPFLAFHVFLRFELESSYLLSRHSYKPLSHFLSPSILNCSFFFFNLVIQFPTTELLWFQLNWDTCFDL